jgi:hypothetical protein
MSKWKFSRASTKKFFPLQRKQINSLEESTFNRSAIKRYVNIKVVVASTCTFAGDSEAKVRCISLEKKGKCVLRVNAALISTNAA